MHDAATKEKFVELRAQGKSFASIAEELGVSKTTLIDWSRQDNEQIMNLRAINNEALREKYRVAKEHQLRTLSSRLEAVEGELEKRGLTDVPTEKLFGVLFKLVEALRGEDRPLILQSTSGMELSDSFQQTNTWTA